MPWRRIRYSTWRGNAINGLIIRKSRKKCGTGWNGGIFAPVRTAQILISFFPIGWRKLSGRDFWPLHHYMISFCIRLRFSRPRIPTALLFLVRSVLRKQGKRRAGKNRICGNSCNEVYNDSLFCALLPQSRRAFSMVAF